jgi:hypothetical protein
LPETFLAPGVIIPPPADLQAEEELAAHRPWDAPSAFADAAEVREKIRMNMDPVQGRGPESECNRSGQHCSGCRSGKEIHGKCVRSTSGGPSKKIRRIEEISEATGAVVGIFIAPIGAVSGAAGVITVADCS